ncbi:phosphopantetheinyl transferase [Legionella lansingensis]|uniref:Phosphopantetheinyl transferase n=1 Tax=Legionella lansingensis TaxID=45067 RepID=A0A0W0VWR6_9GAMM|nr:4'-phosphopantetheinyl transferase superfamily protein [Legionella lansingensis]KTD24361.1 phosphopantetheinyl transferase [Legionella lansingensis]SNV51672.1 phosphopantetheinyl transferase [Legionella lansingensis]
MSLFESMPIDDCHLQLARIDIWEFPLDLLPETAISLLDEKERAQANRFYFSHHQRRFTVAHAMLRAILARYLGESADALVITYGPHGKPQVRNSCHLEFNLSHSGDLALLAIGQHLPLGIDLEFFSARPYEGIAKYLFSKNEVAAFCSLPNYLTPVAFFHLWTQKEAFIKACGLGLSYPTKTFSVPVIMPPTNSRVADSLHQTEWQITSFMPKAGCCAALCFHPEVQQIRYEIVNPLAFLHTK